MPSQFTKVALGCQDAEHAREPLVAHGIGWMRLLTIGSGPSKLRECPPANLRDPHAGDFHRASACDYARSVRVVAIPVRMRSTRKSTVNPCASMIASLQPSGDAASSSSARRRSGFGPRLRPEYVVGIAPFLFGRRASPLGCKLCLH